MEKTSRDSIAHKIKKLTPDNIPNIQKLITEEYKNKFYEYTEKKPSKNRLENLRRIYELADGYIACQESVTVCRKGCAWCCQIPVDVLPIEIDYIEKHTILKRSPKPKPFNPDPEKFYNVGYCPLLDQNTGCCSIYEYRPFNCRLFLVYDDPDLCRRQSLGEDVNSYNSGGAGNGYGSQAMVKLAMDLMALELKRAVQREDQTELDSRIKDIRTYF